MTDTVKYKIEKGVPRISIRGNRGPFLQIAEQMDAGDSVFFSNEKTAWALYRALKEVGKGGETRQENGGRRVWCLPPGEQNECVTNNPIHGKRAPSKNGNGRDKDVQKALSERRTLVERLAALEESL